jgi:hypothetical protein
MAGANVQKHLRLPFRCRNSPHLILPEAGYMTGNLTLPTISNLVQPVKVVESVTFALQRQQFRFLEAGLAIVVVYVLELLSK